MKPVRFFSVTPALPSALEPLRKIAYNLRWAWNHDTIELFRRMDAELWEISGHNPVRMLGLIEQSQFEAAASDPAFLAHMERVSADLDVYLTGEASWFRRSCGTAGGPAVAYFSAEFGLTECLSIFAGGLGVLAGDHLKSASDLGVPLIAVGLLYQQGYFRQYLNEAGWQQEDYEDNDFLNLPVTLERQPDKRPLVIQVAYPGRQVLAQVWRVQVGRVPLYLLDTNIPGNSPEDRDITDQLYGGDLEMRLKQEILLGIGGYAVVDALGMKPCVYHMNEGHSAFLSLERVRRLMELEGLSFSEAREVAASGLVFTGHTPVAAGHDYFPPDMMDRYFSDYTRSLGLSREDFLALGRQDPADQAEAFCMTTLALHLANYWNGVSRLHGRVTRQMWKKFWPAVPEDEIPVGHVTNGVHFRSWISLELNQIYDRYLGPKWREEPTDRKLWQRAGSIPAEELWRAHELRRERLVTFARRRLQAQLRHRGAPQAEIENAEEVLDSGTLTIGFARRFATYKRATLLLRDVERLRRILTDPDRPVQLIMAGKAHPRDAAGKELIRRVVALARESDFRHRIVFLEDYDMAVSRYLVQGVDVWLNTPLRPMEASGTSGMKAAANGVLNLSTLDGWWDEAWRDAESEPGCIGWAIGRDETYEDREYQDQVEADALYEVLERDVIPTFYDRGASRVPRRWVANMKTSIGTLCHYFNTHRMVQDYTERFYLPAANHYQELSAEGAAKARKLVVWKSRIRENWPHVRITVLDSGLPSEFQVQEQVRVRARVDLGVLSPEDVSVQLYMGRLDATQEILEPEITEMKIVGAEAQGGHLYEASSLPCGRSGLHGYTVRALPRHPDLRVQFVPGFIAWGESGDSMSK